MKKETIFKSNFIEFHFHSTHSSKSFSVNSAMGLQIATPALFTSPSIFTFLKKFSSFIRDENQSLKSISNTVIRGLLDLSSFKGSTEREIAYTVAWELSRRSHKSRPSPYK